MLAVVFHDVSKRYRIRQGVGLVRRLRPGGVKDFWAVKDVTFEVGRGADHRRDPPLRPCRGAH